MSAKVLAACLLGVGALAITAAGASPTAVVRGVHFLKVRTSPDFDAAEGGVLAAGDSVEVLEVVGRWAHVALENGRQGYVSRKYLVMTDAGEAATETSGTGDAGAASTMVVPAAPMTPLPPAATATPAISAATAAAPTIAAEPPSSLATPVLPAIAPQTTAMPAPPPSPLPCTRADIDAVRESLRDLAAGQEHLAAVAATAAGGEPPAAQPLDQRSLVWIGAAFVVGVLAGRAVGRRERWRRHRVRV